MKRWALLLAVVGIAAWTGLGCAPAPDGGGPGLAVAADESSARDLEVQRKLQATLGKVEIDDKPLGEVMDWFRQTAKLDIQVKWSALEPAGITPAMKVKLVHLSPVSAENALWAILDDVGDRIPLGYAVEDGYIIVTLKDDLSGPRYRRIVVYDIRDLLPSPEAKIKVVRGKEHGVFAGEEWEGLWPYALRDLCRLIARTIDKDSWMDPYGTGVVGVMSEYGGLLIIQQTYESHRKIAALLADIRRHKPTFK